MSKCNIIITIVILITIIVAYHPSVRIGRGITSKVHQSTCPSTHQQKTYCLYVRRIFANIGRFGKLDVILIVQRPILTLGQFLIYYQETMKIKYTLNE